MQKANTKIYVNLDYRCKTTWPILIKLKEWNKKLDILKKANILKRTYIYVNEDFLKDVQEHRRQLVEHL